jgi:hypothetical protein
MRRTFPFLLLVVSALFVRSALAQSAQLSGQVTDPQALPVPNAEVRVVNQATNVERKTSTNDSGSFTVPYLEVGTYVVYVQAPGFSTLATDPFDLHTSDVVGMQLKLTVEKANQSVTVHADASTIETSAAVSTVIDRQFVENLPLNGRSFNTLLQLTPGVVLGPAGFNVNGQRDDANYYTVDGVSATFGLSNIYSGQGPALTSFGGTNSLLSIDALQEFRIQTSSSDSDSGRTPGGQVEVTTRSGTNSLSGNFFDYFRNDALDANDWFYDQAIGTAPPGTISKPALRQNDFGGTLGGPILKDKTFFFLSYEGLRLTQPQVQYLSVPNRDANGNIMVGGTLESIPSPVNQLVKAFPLPNGPDFGNGFAGFTQTASARQNLDVGGIRIDHALTSRISLFGRASFAASSSLIPQWNYVQTQSLPTRFVTVGMNAQITPRLTEQFRFNYSSSENLYSFNLSNLGGGVIPDVSILLPEPYTAKDETFFQLQSVDGANSAYYETGPGTFYSAKQFNVLDNLSANVNRHVVKVGIDYRRSKVEKSNSVSGFAYTPSISDLAAGGTSSGYVSRSVSAGYTTDNLSLYLQDAWRIGRKLVLTPGLRWDVNTAPTASSGISFVIPLNVNTPANLTTRPGKKLWETTFANLAPRIGIVFSPFASNRIVLRSGLGVYYDFGTNNTGGSLINYPFTSSNLISAFVKLPLDSPGKYLPTLNLSPPFLGGGILLTDPSLKLPYSLQWNFGVSVSLSKRDVMNVTYVGQAGRRLLRDELLSQPNPQFFAAFITGNRSMSNYNSLQIQYVHHLAGGLQAVINYTYSHSQDDLSANFTNSGIPFSLLALTNQYGNSDFDVRHNFSTGVTYDFPNPFRRNVLRKVFGGWGLDSIVYVRTGFPIDVIQGDPNSLYIPLGESRPDRVPGQPFWVSSSTAPGGQSVNPNAFAFRPPDRQGDLPRNAVPGFSYTQWDASLRRTFSLADPWSLTLRLDLFNALNHPNFTNPFVFFNSGSAANPQFGVSTQMLNQSLPGLSSIYQNGGPRSLQLSLKLQF